MGVVWLACLESCSGKMAMAVGVTGRVERGWEAGSGHLQVYEAGVGTAAEDIGS